MLFDDSEHFTVLEIMKIIANNITRRREELGLSKKNLAKMINANEASIHNWEACKSSMMAYNLYRLSIALDVPVEYFFKERGNENVR